MVSLVFTLAERVMLAPGKAVYAVVPVGALGEFITATDAVCVSWTAVQPVAVGKESKHRQLTARLVDRLRSAESKERFEAFGFRWK